MTLANKINRNSIVQIIGKLLSLVLGLITVAIMTRYLGQEGFGYYTTVIAFLQLFGIMADFGLTLTTVQMIAAPGANVNKLMSNIMTFRIISSAIFLGLAPLAILFFPYPAIVKIGVLITAGSYFCVTLIQVLTGVFQKELKMLEVTLAEVIGRVVLVGLTALAAYYLMSINWILAAITIGSAVNLLAVWLYARKYITLKPAFDFDVWRQVLRQTWPIALSISFNLIYLKMDTLILSLVRSPSEVGLYGATYRVVDILTMLPAVYMGIVLPHLTRLYAEKNSRELFDLMQQAFNSLIIFGVPIVLGAYIVSEKLMVLVAGADFAFSGKILEVLILASGAIFVATLFGYAVLAVNKQKTMMWGYLTTAVLTLIGYVIFIPKFGVWGAAWMTVFSEAVIMVWTFTVVYRTVKFMPNLLTAGKSLLAGAVMFAVLYLLKDLHVIWLLLIAGAVYFGIMILIRGVRKGFVRLLVYGEE